MFAGNIRRHNTKADRARQSSPGGKIVAVCVSRRKGTRKTDVGRAYLWRDRGIKADAHSGPGGRQVSLLASESIEKQAKLAPGQGDRQAVFKPGDFAENLTTAGINLLRLIPGSRIRVGARAVLEVTQIGKKCHSACEIRKLSGDCIMPREGIFARVLKSGWVKVNDSVILQTPPRD